MATPILLGRFQVTSSNKDITLTPGGAIAITTGWYYTGGYTGEGTSQLCEEVQTQLQTVNANFTCTYSTTTNLVTLDFDSVSTNVAWTDSDAGLLLGFPSALTTSASNYVAPQQPRYTWMPNHGPSNYAGQASKFWIPVHTSSVQVSPNGATHTVPGYARYVGWLNFELLPQADIQIATTVYRDLEQFFLDVVGPTQPIRVLPDRTSYTSSSYVTGYIAPRDGGTIEGLDEYRSRWQDNYDGLWDVELGFTKQV